jgi:hypothetical protein
MVAAWIGAVGLLLLALSPLFMWLKFGSGGVIGIRGDGKIVLAVTVLAMLAFGVAVLAKKHFRSLLLGLFSRKRTGGRSVAVSS